MLLLSLLVLIPILAGARLAMAPVFVYRPEHSGLWQPLYAGPETGSTLLFSGPYYKLPPGRYRACFRVRNGRGDRSLPLARLQVAASVSSPAKLLEFTRDIMTAAGDSYREEEVSFAISAPSVVATIVSYAGRAPLWIDGVRIRADLHERARWPRAAGLAGLGGLAALAVALWQRRRERRLARALFAAKAGFAAAAGIAVVPLGPLLPPEMTWLLPPALWISGLMLGGGLVLYAVRKLTGGSEPLMTLADVVSDGIFAALVLWTMPNLSLFSLAALATVPWAIKGALMVFTLARSRQGRMLPAAVLIAGFTFLSLLPWYHHYPLSGDQFSYLVETVSLLRHHSVNTWEVINGEEFHEFSRAIEKVTLKADSLTLHGAPGYPARDFGVSLFALPGYLLARVDGARLGMELAAVLLAATLFLLIRQLGVSQSAGVLAWAAICFSLPLLHFSSLLYPELPGALLTAAGLLLIGQPPTTRNALLTGMCAGLLPLMNARYWAIAAPLGILAVLSLRQARQGRLLAALAGPALLLVAAQMIVNAAVYGVALPNAGYFLLLRGANPAIYYLSSPFTHTFYEGWAGIWLDKRWGVLSTAPVFLLAVAGIAALWLRSRVVTMRVLALFLPYFLTVASTDFWNGGNFSLARYLVPVLPLLALPLAAILANRFRILAGILTAAGAVTAMASLASLDSDYDPVRLATQSLNSFGVAVSPWLPSLSSAVRKTPAAPYLLPVWIAVTLLLAFLGRSSKRLRQARLLLVMVFIMAGAAAGSLIWDAARHTATPVKPWAGPVYSLGTVLDFRTGGNATPFEGQGWAPAEPGGSWTLGDLSELPLHVDHVPQSDLLLSVEMHAFTPPQRRRFAVTVSVNDTKLAAWLITDQAQVMRKEIRIPRALVTSSILFLKFENHDPRAPYEFGLSPDKRQVGLAIHSLVLKPIGKDTVLPPADPTVRYTLGRPIDFRAGGNAKLFEEGQGWEAAEAGGSWTLGESSELLLFLDSFPKTDLLLDVEWHAFTPPKRRRFAVTVSVNDTKLADWLITDQAQVMRKQIGIPRALVSSSILFLKFENHDPRSPYEIDLSPDRRKVGMAMHSLALKPIGKGTVPPPVDPTARYMLGRTLDFRAGGNAKQFEGQGWAPAEAGGSWTLGDRSELLLFLDSFPKTDLRLDVEAHAFTLPKRRKFTETVFVNNTKLSDWLITDQAPVMRKTVRIPRALASSGVLLLEFVNDDPRSAQALGYSGDPRKVGLAIHTVRVTVTGPAN